MLIMSKSMLIKHANHARKLQPVTLQKVTLLYGCFSCFLNCAYGTKLRKASDIEFHMTLPFS